MVSEITRFLWRWILQFPSSELNVRLLAAWWGRSLWFQHSHTFQFALFVHPGVSPLLSVEPTVVESRVFQDRSKSEVSLLHAQSVFLYSPVMPLSHSVGGGGRKTDLESFLPFSHCFLSGRVDLDFAILLNWLYPSLSLSASLPLFQHILDFSSLCCLHSFSFPLPISLPF